MGLAVEPERGASRRVAKGVADFELGERSLAGLDESFDVFDRRDLMAYARRILGIGLERIAVPGGLLDRSPHRGLDGLRGDARLPGESFGIFLFDGQKELIVFDLVPPLVQREHHGLLESGVRPSQFLDGADGLRPFAIPPGGDRGPATEAADDGGEKKDGLKRATHEFHLPLRRR